MAGVGRDTIKQIFITGWLVIGLILSIIAFRRFILPLIGAQPPNTAVTHLAPPYMRLTTSEIPTAEDQVAIDINVNTNGIETIEADVIIKYDPEALSINEEGIKLYNQYGVIQIAEVGGGTVDFALFSNPKRGELTVKTAASEEAQIATLLFTIEDKQVESVSIELIFSPGKITDSNLIPFFEVRPETSSDILQSTEGILLSL